jgi:ABC-type Na+ efflux pump permease subunit
LSSKIQKIYAALLAPLLVSIAGLVYWLAFISMADEREKNNLLQVVFLIICLILVLFVIAAYFTMEIKRLAT